MGRKARERATKKHGDKPGAAVRSVKETKTIKRLKKLAPFINTLAEFERMVKQSSRPAWFREHVGPMLRPNLPCCAEMYLATRPGVEAKGASIKHGETCPTRNLVQVYGDVAQVLAREGGLII